LKKNIFMLLLFLCAACGHHHGGDGLNVDPQIGSGNLEVEDKGNIQEPIELIDENLNTGISQDADLNPIFFRYDESQIEEDQVPVLLTNAKSLSHSAIATFIIEGHCDERGTEEYNLALGDRRAKAAKDYLVSLGVDPKRIGTISYGESHPFENGHDEGAWRLNRRAQFIQQ
jgi:peptidoglycan-associated lipoprotein